MDAEGTAKAKARPTARRRPKPKHPPYCDLVMKGGITSGIVYPLAVVKLAAEYKFKSIGGASAGAIAAAATAAAECGRRNGIPDTFNELAQVARTMAKGNNLLDLFQPSPGTRPVFQVLIDVLVAKGAGAKLWAAVKGLFKGFPVAALAGALIGVALPFDFYATHSASLGASIVLGSLWVVLGATTGALIHFAVTAVREIASNGFGLCPGFDENQTGAGAPLTNWLDSLLNRLAGKTGPDPLTFGDLWSAPQDDAERLLTERAVDLQVMTTNLTHGRPYWLPFPPRRVDASGKSIFVDSPIFYFDPARWRKLFPSTVVDWMEKHAMTLTSSDPAAVPAGETEQPGARPVTTADGAILVPLPEMEDLPVVVAARMSLSFPGLISAVPLHSVDYTAGGNQTLGKNAAANAEICWFSDGGICSNFPIHFFDSPLPRWPTFGINLKSPHPDHLAEADLVWLPTANRDGLAETWNRFDQGSATNRLAGFAGAILGAMQNWRDAMQTRVPGYRDRVVHISLGPEEGGLNLKMDETTIKHLVARGERAGELLLTFDFDNHVWVRYRSLMSTMDAFLGDLAESYTHPLPENQAIWQIIEGKGTTQPPSYRWNLPQATFAPTAAKELVDVALKWPPPAAGFRAGCPRPEPELRITPQI
jgi:predicted acylesterase/phospholipase RssA